MKSEKTDPLVSIVITTKNEEKNIQNCLKSISFQTYNKIEVIVIDNNSQDQTKKIARRFTTLIFDRGPERSAQRNFGMISKSHGKYVIYIDADMILSPNLIQACVKHMESSKAVALYISEQILGKSIFCRIRNFERSFYDGTPIDGARFFKKNAFVNVGGFDEELFINGSGEDWDIDKMIKEIGTIELLDKNILCGLSKAEEMNELFSSLRIDYKSDFTGIYHNETQMTLGLYFRKKFSYSVAFSRYIKKWGEHDPDIRKQFGLYYRFFGVFMENGKWIKIIKKPHLALGMYFLRFIVGLLFLLRRLIR